MAISLYPLIINLIMKIYDITAGQKIQIELSILIPRSDILVKAQMIFFDNTSSVEARPHCIMTS